MCIEIKYIETETNKRRKNSDCRLFRESDETMNYKINDCSKIGEKGLQICSTEKQKSKLRNNENGLNLAHQTNGIGTNMRLLRQIFIKKKHYVELYIKTDHIIQIKRTNINIVNKKEKSV